MAVQPLEIIVTGNTDGATSELKKVQNELGNTAITAQKAGGAFINFSNYAGKSIFTLTEKLRQLESAVFTEKSIEKINVFNRQIEVTKAEINSLSNAGKAGFDGLGNAISKNNSKLSDLGKSLTTGLSGIRQLAYILPGIGIAGIFNLAGEAIGKLITGIFGVSEAAKEMQKNIDESFKKASDSVGEEISKVTVLTSVLQSENATRLQKKEALKELKAINADYFGQLQIEDGKVSGLTTSYDKYITRLFRSITAKANVEQLTTALKEQANIVGEINKNKADASFDNLSEFQIFDAIRRFNLNFGAKKGQQIVLSIDQQQLIVDLLNAEDKVKKLTNTIKTDVRDIFNPKIEKEKKLPIEKKVETIADIIAKLRLELDYLNSKELTLKTDEAKAKISALEGTIKTLFEKFNLKNDNKIVVGLYGEIKEIQLTEKLKNNLKFNVDAPEFVLRPKIDIEPVFNSRGWIDKIIDEIDLARKKAADKLKSFQDLVAASIKEIETGALVGLGEAIGNALGGKGDIFRGLFDSIFSSVGDQLKNLGKFLIASGIEIKIAKDAFRKLLANPIASIAVGIGLVALGALLKSQIGKQAPGFATGVRNYGGGLALVGERGPELVTLPKGSSVQTNGQLNGMSMDNWAGNVVFEIDGIKLRGLLQRTDSYANRNGF